MMSRNSFTRVTAATALGAAVTAAVLWLMQALIENDDSGVDETPRGATLTFLPVLQDKPPKVHDERVQPPDKPDTPPPPPPSRRYDGTGPVIGVDVTRPEIPVTLGPSAGLMTDGDALAVVKVRPVYPQRAASQGIEGYVLVQFTIDELGRVVDVRVVAAEPQGVFERAALHAVERFRYKPRVVNGTATTVSGVQHLVTFKLDS